MIKLVNLLKEAMNQDLYIGESNIHGNGLFSNIDIPSNEMFTPIGDATLLPDEDALNIYGKHINHSDNPNVTVEITDTDIVLNSIKPINMGDEIVVDYTALPPIFDRNVDEFTLNENKRIIHVKNVNYFQQVLDQANGLSANDRNYIQGVINSIKKYNGMATEVQYNFLKKRLG